MTKLQNIPELRFPKFEGGWILKTLGDLGQVSMCKRIMKNQTSSEGEIPFYKIGTFGKQANAFISKNLYEKYKSKYSFPQKGDILISAAGTIGRTVIYDGCPAYFQDSNIVWIDNDEDLVTNNFLSFCYQNIKWNTENTTIARLYNNNLRNIKIIVPGMQSEQTKIAQFLTAIDKRINLLTKKKQKLEQYKKGIMQKIFSQEIRFKITNEDGEFVEQPEWEEKKLGEICELIHGYQFRSNDFTQHGLVIIKISNVIGTELSLEEVSFIDKKRFSEFERFEIQNGDILMSLTGNIGRVIEVKNKPYTLIQNYRVGKFCPFDEEYLTKPFLKILLMSDIVFGRFNQLSNQSAQANFGKQDMDKIKLYIPKKAEQQKIAQFLSSIDKMIEQISTQIEKSKMFKKGLLQKMFV